MRARVQDPSWAEFSAQVHEHQERKRREADLRAVGLVPPDGSLTRLEQRDARYGALLPRAAVLPGRAGSVLVMAMGLLVLAALLMAVGEIAPLVPPVIDLIVKAAGS